MSWIDLGRLDAFWRGTAAPIETLEDAAETILQIASARDEDRAQLDLLAMEVDVLADQLMKIGARTNQSLPS